MRYLLRLLSWVGLLALCAITQAADPLNVFLDECDGRYSDEHQMLGQEFHSPGYHTTVALGTWVHPVLPSLDYALGLLQRNSPGDRQRAEKIIDRVIGLQDADPASRTYGIWPWLLEEPLEKMSPPDWNWADFCGARLAVMLADHGQSLSDELKPTIRTSLRHAALAIKKRNVGPGYTNIAIMGGGVCAAAGEILGDAELLKYGRQRLQQVAVHAGHHGGFNEYNSPTYTMVALAECERTIHLVRDEATRQAAESLRRVAWRTIADSYHPGTGQWAGPHARSYSDYLFPRTATYLTEQTLTQIPAHPKADMGRAADLPVPWRLPCPDELRARFQSLPSETCELRRTFIRGETPQDSTIGTTWLTADACLGSINRGTFWTQCRPLIGYWKTDTDPAVVLRLRFLHDGRDFASMGVATAQSGGKSLAVVYPLRNRGDWHPTLDRPADGLFSASDFRLQLELVGRGVKLDQMDQDRWGLRAGQYRAVVHALPGRFAGQAVVWQAGEDLDRVFVDAVCYQGPSRSFDFKVLPEVVLAAGIEILPAEALPSEAPRLTVPTTPTVEAIWNAAQGLAVAAPMETSPQ
ncbi:MAG: hypothetical protein GXY83_26540 [Rhodopirellula sp.]|nr:hypothetical protein [Rhodopirellula sp.]